MAGNGLGYPVQAILNLGINVNILKQLQAMIYFKKLVHRFFFLTALVVMIGCSDYLDVVPDNTPSLDDAFSNRAVTEAVFVLRFSYLPKYHHP